MSSVAPVFAPNASHNRSTLKRTHRELGENGYTLLTRQKLPRGYTSDMVRG